MVKGCHFQTHAGLLPEQLSAGAGSPRAGQLRRRRRAVAAAAPSGWRALGGAAALLRAGRLGVPPRRCPRWPAGLGRAAGLACGRGCWCGRHCRDDFLFRPLPEDAETPARARGGSGPCAPPAGFLVRPLAGGPPAAGWAWLSAAAEPELSPEPKEANGLFPGPPTLKAAERLLSLLSTCSSQKKIFGLRVLIHLPAGRPDTHIHISQINPLCPKPL